ncbi:unnamed protein product [Prorocentrum cordatum]|uniref:Uncharacterized protein n=1 Tax=Prorocentrum cordatum TaxID=2364126 RepID=A0ABN9QQQ0_9DINO|nr:unnamed protein product [Polarella glacialis]
MDSRSAGIDSLPTGSLRRDAPGFHSAATARSAEPQYELQSQPEPADPAHVVTESVPGPECIQAAENKVTILAEMALHPVSHDMDSAAAEQLLAAVERFNVLEAEAIAALATARIFTQTSSSTAATPTSEDFSGRVEAAKKELVKTKIKFRRWIDLLRARRMLPQR